MLNLNKPEREQWFASLGYGMFVHWSFDVRLGMVISHSMVGASDDYLDRYVNELPKHFNPEKFSESYQQTKEFDHVTHRNIINTYDIAIRKLKSNDVDTKSLIASCQKLADFSKALVDQSYPRAMSHQSKYDILSDAFFIEINQIVKFDHNIGVFDKNAVSFKQLVEEYRETVQDYIAKYKNELPEEIIGSL